MTKKKDIKVEREMRVSIREEIKQLLREIDEKRYDLYIKIYEVKENQQYIEWGYEKFREWIEEDLGLEYRVGLWYAQMGETIVKYNIPKDVILSISWTKFKEIAQLDSWEDIDRLLKKAPSMTFREVEAEVKQIKKKVGGEKRTTTMFKVNLKEDQWEVVNQAIETAKQEAQTDSTATALEFICQEYLVNKEEGDELFEFEEE